LRLEERKNGVRV